MLADNSRFDGHPIYIETPEKLEIRHLEQTKTNAKNELMVSEIH